MSDLDKFSYPPPDLAFVDGITGTKGFVSAIKNRVYVDMHDKNAPNRGSPSWLRVSSAGEYVAAAWPATEARAFRIEVWDAATGRKVSQMDCEPSVTKIAFSPDGKRLAIQGGKLRDVWRVHDAATGVEVARLIGDTGLDLCSAFSPDDRLFASVREGDFRVDIKSYVGRKLTVGRPHG